jgi:hypothetical protein
VFALLRHGVVAHSASEIRGRREWFTCWWEG